ncbi:MAG: amidohydrolase [Thermoplasmata archaeon]|nr:amidohydrolase [Thermoplasmata archaeon]
MTSISIRNAILNGEMTNIQIEDHLITEIGKAGEADRIINARKRIVMPGLVNTHTHAAMALLRGYADDMELQPWLEKKIWPMEKHLKPEHNYWGTRLACLEMIKSGTVAFNDMYINMEEAARAVDDAGIRAVIGYGFVDMFNEEKREAEIKGTKKLVKHINDMKSPRIRPSVAPHAIYTVSDEGLQWCASYARENELLLHMHVSETEKENNDCIEQRDTTPVCHLDELGFLGPDLISAHSVWLDDEEIGIYAKKGVKVSYNPVSNMKLGVARAMPYVDMRRVGMEPTLGTDGCASNNNLDMFESMKIAALLQKYKAHPTVLPHHENILMTTLWGAKALRLPTGEVAVGKEADLILVDTQRADMTPLHNPGSNIVYSTNGSAVSTVICRGRLLMEERKVKGEDIVLKKAAEAASSLAKAVREEER